MKCIKIDLPSEFDRLEVHVLADLHLGDKNCDAKLIKDRIEYIKNNEKAYCILNGDLINNATKTSVSDIYSEQLKPMEQIKLCVDLFEPIRDKIMAVTQGNHEARGYRNEGIDITELMARQLEIDDRYSAGAALLFIRFGLNQMRKRKQWYTLFINHGRGGGRKEGAKAIRLADMASIVDADIYVHSHTHLPMVFKQAFNRVDTSNSTVNSVNKLFVNTAAALDYGGYGEVQEYKPASKDTPVIYLSGTRKEFYARL